jgi:hypothetical protein
VKAGVAGASKRPASEPLEKPDQKKTASIAPRPAPSSSSRPVRRDIPVTQLTQSPSTPATMGITGPPVLPYTKFSPQPLADRQKAREWVCHGGRLTAVRTLYAQFEKLVGVVHNVPALTP